ncbi:hypothetical protein BS50DRAFT_593860 [Corynespora cassiicola Philippines]|uniref:SnoaL-like domain-containing protein n=1 Tax=Corynespora cassiicola Philippines TaxID=1448308 RepID=A0A2T2N4R5_CORCC|nr:hypothetical protein BS50DRAFT_593860 [Corynespora cassiicola Philippines]
MATPADLIRNVISRIAITLFSLFTPDAILEYPPPVGVHTGMPSAHNTVNTLLGNHSPFHSLTTQTIEIRNNTVTTVTYASISVAVPGVEGLQTRLGWYEDSLIENNGVWIVNQRTFKPFQKYVPISTGT